MKHGMLFVLGQAVGVPFIPLGDKGRKRGLDRYWKIDRRETRGMMVERYRNHLIFVKADQDATTALWKAATHVQFNEDPVTFRDVWLPRPAVGQRTKRSAEKQMMKEAKKWVDDRLRETTEVTLRAPSADSEAAE
jgi:hypothetical protein